MEKQLKEILNSGDRFDDEYTNWVYSEDVNKDALTDDWLENNTSYIYKVGVLLAIDSNKCDWVTIAIGTQRSENSNVELKGIFNFNRGENDDIGRVIDRAVNLIKFRLNL